MDLAYEKQEMDSGQRMCGAAALCMVYRSFGAHYSQRDVWPVVSRADARGHGCARSHLLCADALGRGYAALTIQVRRPWWVLQRAAVHGIRLIVNHRMSLSGRDGHFAVVVRVEEDGIVLHDPQLGPKRRIAQAVFLKLWQPGRGASEVSGNVLVAFAAAPPERAACRRCGAFAPRSVPCPACQRTIPLEPGVLLGCMTNACSERAWARVFCPFCDAALSELGSGGRQAG